MSAASNIVQFPKSANAAMPVIQKRGRGKVTSRQFLEIYNSLPSDLQEKYACLIKAALIDHKRSNAAP